MIQNLQVKSQLLQKNKIQPVNLEIQLALLRDSRISIPSSNLQGAQEVIQSIRFYRKKGGARELLTKEMLIFRLGHILLGGKKKQGIIWIASSFCWAWRETM